MNKRRWIAVGVACGLLLLSIIVALIPGKDKEEASNTTLTGINKIFYGSNEITEETLEEGASNKKIVKLSVNGVIADTGESNLFSREQYNHQNFLTQLKKIQEDKAVKGVLLEVNSPGRNI